MIIGTLIPALLDVLTADPLATIAGSVGGLGTLAAVGALVRSLVRRLFARLDHVEERLGQCEEKHADCERSNAALRADLSVVSRELAAHRAAAVGRDDTGVHELRAIARRSPTPPEPMAAATMLPPPLPTHGVEDDAAESEIDQ